MQLFLGDCLEVMRGMESSSVDAIVTDPPYGLSFMGKKWDYDVPSIDIWRDCFRVLKHGGHLLSFAGTKTQHRMAVNIEDAGFEIRDMIAWVYGSGFPKSLDVSKAIDKAAPRAGMFDDFASHLSSQLKASGKTQKEVASLFPSKTGGITGCVWNWANGAAVPTLEQWAVLQPLLELSPEWLPLIERIEAEREVIGTKKAAPGVAFSSTGPTELEITAPATEAAKQWSGWGTALKPALEPITVARKPLIGTVSENVLVHGTGALNIDGCRVGEESTRRPINNIRVHGGSDGAYVGQIGNRPCDGRIGGSDSGRWPANLIHDGGEYFGEQSRFFYCAKANKKDRGENNNHPTVKPTDLMRYLCRLVTPPGGIILDPFMGSGSTGKAARLESFDFIGIERDESYFHIAKARIEAAQ